MKKDKTIIDLFQRLKIVSNFSLLHTVDYWDADLCALGLQRDDKLVYISTFNYIDNEIIKYDYDFEIIDKNEDKI
jgi:DNA-binding MltR family transcriptional regulator